MTNNSAYTHLIENLQKGGIETLALFAKKIFLQKTTYESHSSNIEFTAVETAKNLKLSAYNTELIRYAMILHDIGKILLSDQILNKPAKLTEEEFNFIKTHSLNGFNLIKDINKDVAAIIIQHHEKIDGSGYPYGIKDVKLESQVISIIDVFDALIKERPYKKAFPVQNAVDLILSQSGKTWDEKVVSAFMDTLPNIR
jgi:putative nucleotidyltransferase with HDIG domain